MMQVLLLVLFVVYLYVPYLVFKFFVEESFDLTRRRDATRVEEFFGAAWPSLLLNVATYAMIRIVGTVFGRRWPPPVDWNVVAGLFDPQLLAVRAHVGRGLVTEGFYSLALLLVACCGGYLYGNIELALMRRAAGADFFRLQRTLLRKWMWLLALGYRRVWLSFFAELIHPVTAMLENERGSWLFVRTRDDRLYYGRLYEYTKNSNGDIETLAIDHAQRYARSKVPDCLAQGRSPLTRLSGVFVMKWSEIADFNVAEPSVIMEIRRGYARSLRAARRKRG